MIPARFGQKFVNKQEKKRPSIQKRRILDRTSGEKGGECALRPSRGSEGLEGAQGNHKAPSGSSEASKGMGTPPEYKPTYIDGQYVDVSHMERSISAS